MIALVKYMLTDLHRSNRYFMPAVCYGLLVLWMYSVRPNPVLESYSATVALAFGCALWFSVFLMGDAGSGGFGRFRKKPNRAGAWTCFIQPRDSFSIGGGHQLAVGYFGC